MKNFKLSFVIILMIVFTQIYIVSFSEAATSDNEIKITHANTIVDIENHWAYKQIQDLYELKIIDATKKGEQNFIYPEVNITRADFIKALVLSNNLVLKNGKEKVFLDIKKDNKYKEFIDIATSNEIVNGYKDDTFRPLNNITRAEIAVLTSRILDKSITLEIPTTSKFIDVDKDAWFFQDVSIATVNEVFSGYQDNTFKPNNSIKRGEAFIVIYNLMERKRLLEDINSYKMKGKATKNYYLYSFEPKNPDLLDYKQNLTYSNIVAWIKDIKINKNNKLDITISFESELRDTDFGVVRMEEDQYYVSDNFKVVQKNIKGNTVLLENQDLIEKVVYRIYSTKNNQHFEFSNDVVAIFKDAKLSSNTKDTKTSSVENILSNSTINTISEENKTLEPPLTISDYIQYTFPIKYGDETNLGIYNSIYELQILLNKYCYHNSIDLIPDSSYGPHTIALVKLFQEQNYKNVVPTGEVTKEMFADLKNGNLKITPLRSSKRYKLMRDGTNSRFAVESIVIPNKIKIDTTYTISKTTEANKQTLQTSSSSTKASDPNQSSKQNSNTKTTDTNGSHQQTSNSKTTATNLSNQQTSNSKTIDTNGVLIQTTDSKTKDTNQLLQESAVTNLEKPTQFWIENTSEYITKHNLYGVRKEAINRLNDFSSHLRSDNTDTKVYFFEGAGDYFEDGRYGAMVVVIKGNIIVWHSTKASTLPGEPLNFYPDKKGHAVIYPGIYDGYSLMHLGKYPAIQIGYNGSGYIPSYRITDEYTASNGINAHAGPNSTGCINIHPVDYIDFAKAVGFSLEGKNYLYDINYNLFLGNLNNMKVTCIVDRSLVFFDEKVLEKVQSYFNSTNAKNISTKIFNKLFSKPIFVDKSKA